MKIIFTLALCLLLLDGHTQNASVEKSVYGIQTGFFGVWAYNEFRLFHSMSLRSEVGFEASEFGYASSSHWTYTFNPVISAGPRWYYNLEKRQEMNKRIEKNSGDFFEINLNFAPMQPAISIYDKSQIGSNLGVEGKWGIRRHAGEHFCFEAGLAGGVGYTFYPSEFSDQNETYYNAKIYLRIGYTFQN